MRLQIAQLSRDPTYLASLYGQVKTLRPRLQPATPISPGKPVRCIVPTPDGTSTISVMHWGYTPATDGQQRPEPRAGLRVEVAATEPVFQPSWQAGRCLIPMDAWFEWQGVAEHAVAFGIRLPGGVPMYAAAMISPGDTPRQGAGVVLICAQEGNGLLDAQGQRPVILGDEEARAWLDPRTSAVHARLLALEFLLPPPAFEWRALGEGRTQASLQPAARAARSPARN